MTTTIPLDDDDIAKLARLSVTWDCSPQEALKRCLNDSISAEFDPADDEVLHEIRGGQVTEHRVGLVDRGGAGEGA